MNNLVQELKAAVDKTSTHAVNVVSGDMTGMSAVVAILDGVIDQNLVVAEYWRILLRDIQRLAGAVADRTQEQSSDVKRSQFKVAP